MTPPGRGRGLTAFLWVVVGLVAALALASIISVGMFILPFPIAGAILLLSRPRKVVAAAVLLAAAGDGPLLLAYVNRPGPGLICHTHNDGVACGDYLNPWPWLTLGAVLWLGSGILFARANRRPRPTGDVGADREVIRPVPPQPPPAPAPGCGIPARTQTLVSAPTRYGPLTAHHLSPPSGWQATDTHRPGNTPSAFDSAKNTPATTGLALGIISPFVGPLAGIAGLVLSGIGLSRSNTYSRAGHSPVGHKKAIWGLILSSLGTTLSIGLLILLLGH